MNEIMAFIAFAVCGAMYDVREYGAVGDGMTIDTPAIQRAVDEASKAGGGTVAIGSGRYVVANLTLKDNVTLRLAKDAVLLGATNEVDYVDGIMSVVSAFKARNIAIEGEGTIDGRGWAAPLKHPRRWRDVHFRNCGNVRVEDVTLKDPAFWTFFLQECEDCIVRGVRIFAHANFNNDGIDIEAKRVLVENCVIDSDDDAICPKSYNPDFVCEDVEVRNCVLASNCNFIKFGTTSHGTFRNCYIHHCKLRPCAVSRLRFWDECS
ncbi:MAG: right-handed parallel beta-helix repeat-containing protein, partial [Kiritimatiellae bacterium]|nr:right-handed parallel beta-helix repeat-containing protein [Kiritimatiellia bacterium]